MFEITRDKFFSIRVENFCYKCKELCVKLRKKNTNQYRANSKNRKSRSKLLYVQTINASNINLD